MYDFYTQVNVILKDNLQWAEQSHWTMTLFELTVSETRATSIDFQIRIRDGSVRVHVHVKQVSALTLANTGLQLSSAARHDNTLL